jgi:hypothetical protein
MTSKHGGARPGAGRKPREPRQVQPIVESTEKNQLDARTFLESCVNDTSLDAALRIKAAGLLLVKVGKVAARERAKAENLGAFDLSQSWQERLMEELKHDTSH